MSLDKPRKLPDDRTVLETHQLERLRQLLAEIVPRNQFWTDRLAASGVRADEIRTLADLQRLPLTTKELILTDQAAHPPYGSNLTYAPSEYTRLHQTSGTTGTPLRWLDTSQSWEWIKDCWTQLFRLMGLRKEDRLFFAFSFGPFLGFWAGFEGACRLGNFCISAGGMSSLSRLNLLAENEATVLCCTPTYALRLAEVAAEQKIDLRKSSVRAILVAGEPGGAIPATRQRIEEAWGGRVFDHWGMTELGPLAIEPVGCSGGMCLLETECIAEIIEPQTGQPVLAGEEGELVVTNLGRWGSPLFRYRTGDRVRESLPAADRRQSVGTTDWPFKFLDQGILGRTDDMLTIRGNNLYPAALEDVIRQFAEIAEFRIELGTLREMQHVRIVIEPIAGLSEEQTQRLASQVAEAIQARWNFQAEVVLAPPASLPRFEMKARRFVRFSGP